MQGGQISAWSGQSRSGYRHDVFCVSRRVGGHAEWLTDLGCHCLIDTCAGTSPRGRGCRGHLCSCSQQPASPPSPTYVVVLERTPPSLQCTTILTVGATEAAPTSLLYFLSIATIASPSPLSSFAYTPAPFPCLCLHCCCCCCC